MSPSAEWTLKIEKAAVEGERRTVEADLGPVRDLATLIGADNETVLRWFILVVALLLDPAAVAVAAGVGAARRLNMSAPHAAFAGPGSSQSGPPSRTKDG
jgi:hypothetical protein